MIAPIDVKKTLKRNFETLNNFQNVEKNKKTFENVTKKHSSSVKVK